MAFYCRTRGGKTQDSLDGTGLPDKQDSQLQG